MEQPGRLEIGFKIAGIDDERRMVYGTATAEVLDKQNDVVGYDASVRAFNRWPGNVREQHDPKKAVGRAVEITPIPGQKAIRVGVYVSKSQDGQNTWTKLKEGILQGFSVKGPVHASHTEMVKDAGGVSKRANWVDDYDLEELSFVDHGACPVAKVDLIKSVDGQIVATDVLAEPEPPKLAPAVVAAMRANVLKTFGPVGLAQFDAEHGYVEKADDSRDSDESQDSDDKADAAEGDKADHDKAEPGQADDGEADDHDGDAKEGDAKADDRGDKQDDAEKSATAPDGEDTIEKADEPAGDGHWITIHGHHLFITNKGNVHARNADGTPGKKLWDHDKDYHNPNSHGKRILDDAHAHGGPKGALNGQEHVGAVIRYARSERQAASRWDAIGRQAKYDQAHPDSLESNRKVRASRVENLTSPAQMMWVNGHGKSVDSDGAGPVLVKSEGDQAENGDQLPGLDDAAQISKAGQRHSAADLAWIQQAHDMLCNLGASCTNRDGGEGSGAGAIGDEHAPGAGHLPVTNPDSAVGDGSANTEKAAAAAPEQQVIAKSAPQVEDMNAAELSDLITKTVNAAIDARLPGQAGAVEKAAGSGEPAPASLEKQVGETLTKVADALGSLEKRIVALESQPATPANAPVLRSVEKSLASSPPAGTDAQAAEKTAMEKAFASEPNPFRKNALGNKLALDEIRNVFRGQRTG